MGVIVPKLRPKFSRDWLFKKLFENSSQSLQQLQGIEVFLVGIRGYYMASMGVPTENDFDLYDDALALVSLKDLSTYNCTVDPALKKVNVAQLPEGIIWFKQGPHGISRDNPYPALRQSRPVSVLRYQKDGTWLRDKPDWPYTNLHRGGFTKTGSRGCITVYPKQWDEFLERAYAEMDAVNQKEIPCIIMEARG